jgi:hypothetical protein
MYEVNNPNDAVKGVKEIVGELNSSSNFGVGIMTGNQEVRFGEDSSLCISLCITLCCCCCSGGSGGSGQMKKVG